MLVKPKQANYISKRFIYTEKCGLHTSLHPTPPGLRITSSGQDKSNANTHTNMISRHGIIRK